MPTSADQQASHHLLILQATSPPSKPQLLTCETGPSAPHGPAGGQRYRPCVTSPAQDEPTWGCADPPVGSEHPERSPRSGLCIKTFSAPFPSLHEGQQNPFLHFAFKFISTLGPHSEIITLLDLHSRTYRNRNRSVALDHSRNSSFQKHLLLKSFLGIGWGKKK